MNSESFDAGALTYSRRPELFPDGRILVGINDTDGAWAISAEQAMELAQFLLGDMDIFQMFLGSEMVQAHKESGEAEITAVRNYNDAVIDACAGMSLCEQCQATVPVDLKKQARKVRELNKILFEEIEERVEKGELVYEEVQRSTSIIIDAMAGIQELCQNCEAQFHSRIRKAFFRIRRAKRYEESSKGGTQE